MEPRILGVFTTEKSQKMGKGGTTRDFVQKIRWFVIETSNGEFAVLPENDQGLPMPLVETVSRKTFMADYAPDPLALAEVVAPVLAALKARLAPGQPALVEKQLPENERALFAALCAVHAVAPAGSDPRATAMRLVATASTEKNEVIRDQQANINTFGIALRKERHFDGAIAYYQKALELDPTDDHILFNIARAHFDKGDATHCRQFLDRALKANPDFIEARKFLNYLGRVAPEATIDRHEDEHFDLPEIVADRRTSPRLAMSELGISPPCRVKKEKTVHECVLTDVSPRGMGLTFPEPFDFAKGDTVVVQTRLSGSPLLSKPITATGRWSDGARAGFQFDSPLPLDLDGLKRALDAAHADE